MITPEDLMNLDREYVAKFGRDKRQALIQEFGGGVHPRSVPEDRVDAFAAKMRAELGDGSKTEQRTDAKPPPHKIMTLAETHAELDKLQRSAWNRFNHPPRRRE